MLVTKKIKIRATSRVVKYYNNLGYNCKCDDLIEICIEHLSKQSSIMVEVRCEGGCEKNYFVRYCNYIKSIENGYLKDSCCTTCSRKISFNKKNNPMLNSDIANFAIKKSKEAIFKKYGVQNIIDVPGAKEKLRVTRELKGYIIPKYLLSPFQLFKSKCMSFTRKNKKELFRIWDGNDFYDNEYIKDNLKLKFHDALYPTVDHKISMLYGFINNISPDIIGGIDNMCITKRKINSTKHEMSEHEFRIYFKKTTLILNQ